MITFNDCLMEMWNICEIEDLKLKKEEMYKFMWLFTCHYSEN